MNIFEIYYTAVANSYDTDFDGAKEIIAKFMKDLKKEIDESEDEEVKILWNEEFGGEDTPMLKISLVRFLCSVIIRLYRKRKLNK